MCATSSNRAAAAAGRCRAGFTLLELLIALLLLSLLTAALYASFFTVATARERAGQAMEGRRELGTTLDLLRREIAACRFSAGDRRLRFVVQDRDHFGKPSSGLELTTLAPPRTPQEPPGSGIRVIRYELVERDGRSLLLRREQDLLFDWQAAVAYPQMERISGFLVECYNGSSWVRSWDTAAALNGRLPARVRIRVQVEEDNGIEEYSVLAIPQVSGP